MSKSFSKQDFERLKSDVETAQRESDRARGSLDQLEKRLKDQFECDSLEQAKGLLSRIQKRRDELKTDFDRKMNDYQKKFKKEDF